MNEFKIERYEPKGMYIVTLFSNGHWKKKVAECYEEDYAFAIAKHLAENSGSKFDNNVYKEY